MQRTAEHILDESLVLRSKSGDASAHTELIERWHPRLYRHARRLVDHVDAAEEVMQESWLAIVRMLSRLDDPARFGPWAYRIVTNKCADWTRRRARDRARGLHNASDPEHAIASERAAEEPGADQRRIESDALLRAMRQLSPEHRATLALHYMEEMRIAEIAVATGVPVGTVKSRLHHARERLRAIIEQSERKEP